MMVKSIVMSKLGNKKKQLLVIGNPENRRIQFWLKAVAKSGHTCRVVSYLELLQSRLHFDGFIPSHCLIRIESPGENFEVTKRLIALGANSSLENQHPISLVAALNLPLEKGRIRYTRQWFLGFQLFLKQLEQYAASLEQVHFINQPSSIAFLFDKLACQDFLYQKNIPVPSLIGQVKNYEHFQSLLSPLLYQQVFLKPIHGSSASGVLAYRRFKDKEMLTTSVELITDQQQVKLYNSLKIKKYTKHQSIQQIINSLAKDGLYAEQWIPKASNPSGAYDFRMVTIGGQARQVIARQSHSPMTNLHLGNRRGDLQAIQAQISATVWNNLQQLANSVAQLFEDLSYIGMDVLLANDYRSAMILELNAFGDLLPNCWHLGEDTYEAVWKHCQRSK